MTGKQPLRLAPSLLVRGQNPLLPKGLQGVRGLTVERPQSNIVFADLTGDRAAGLIPHLKSRGVLATGLYRLRFVTHLDVDADGVDRAAAAVREYLN